MKTNQVSVLLKLSLFAAFLNEITSRGNVSAVRTENDFTYGNFMSSANGTAFQKSGTVLYGKVFQSEEECLMECLLEHKCVAVNIAILGENMLQCQLIKYGKSDFSHFFVRRNNSRTLRLKTVCYPNPCKNNGMCSPEENGQAYRCNCSKNFGGTNCQHGCIIFDFEHGLEDWTRTGTAFNNQPTYRDNPTARGRGQPSNHEGDWWIGGFENRSSPSLTAGASQGDGPTGTLTSPTFIIRGANLTFLIGGGCDINVARAELVIGGTVVSKATGRCTESMVKKFWDVNKYKGRTAKLRLVDSGSVDWQHINFDHLVDGLCSEKNVN